MFITQKEILNVHSMLVSWSFIKEEAHKDTFTFSVKVLLVKISNRCPIQRNVPP